MLEELAPTNDPGTSATPQPCPHCGYCPVCGRGGYQPTPYQPAPWPTWPYLYPVWSGWTTDNPLSTITYWPQESEQPPAGSGASRDG
jgi:hypothetical protein